MEISIIIATYNRAPILKKCLEHLSKQQGVDFEVIVVDDGSTDNTQEIVASMQGPKTVSVISSSVLRKTKSSELSPESLANFLKTGKPPKKDEKKKDEHSPKANWSRLKYIKQKNAHQGVARNRGIKEAKADLILFVDDDIFVQPDFVKNHHDRHLEHSDESVVVLGFTTWDPALEINDYMRFLEATGWQFGYPFLNPGMIGKQQPYRFFYTSNLSLKKSFFLKEQFNETFKGYGFEDIELGYRLWKDHDMKLYYEPKASAYHHNLILESDLTKKMRSIGRSAVHFNKLHPNIGILPRGLKKWLIKLATNPLTLPLTRLLGKNMSFKFRSWRDFFKGVES